MLEVTKIRPLDKAPLVASLSIKIDTEFGVLSINDLLLFIADRKKWLGMPGKKTDNGKYFNYVFFDDREKLNEIANQAFEEYKKYLENNPQPDSLPF